MVPPPPSLDDLVPAAPLPGVAIISRTDFQVKQLEAKPADNLELYWVEGAHYLRQAGDTLFQRFLFSERDFAATDRWRRTLIGLPEDFRHSLVFYVPREQSLAPVEAISDKLTYLGDWYTFHLYRGKATLPDAHKLSDLGIAIWQDANYPPITTDPVLSKIPGLQEQLLRDFIPVDTEAIIKEVRLEMPGKQGALTPGSPQQRWPNLIPYTPPGPPPWPAPTMLQNYDTLYVYRTTDLFIGEPFLFHWSAANIGDTISWTGYMAIGIDTASGRLWRTTPGSSGHQ